MKTIKYLAVFFIASLSACSSDNESNPGMDELSGLVLYKEMSNETHVIEIYSKSGALQQGYNDILMRIRDKSTGNYITGRSVSWMPLMHMTSMTHSCPFSDVSRIAGTPHMYRGSIIFQMPQNGSEYWTLRIDYAIDDMVFTVEDIIDVPASARRRVNSFMGADGSSYIVAMVRPDEPEVALNDMSAAIFKMESMMNYTPVEGYTLKIDPRMPSMGNHGSPNNTDLIQDSSGLFSGKLSLTMTGYWRINLQLLNAAGENLKGEAITDANPQSSIYFELEF